jgi:putative phosphoribosyl transferase
MHRDDDEAPTRFRDRRDAGRRLAARLLRYRERPRAVVLGLPRGGVVPAAEVSEALRLPLDVVISRKIGAPGNPELALGAIAEGGEPYVNPEVAAMTGASKVYVAREVERQRAEITRRQQLFRGGASLELPARATVILVDDGVATGATVIAAIPALRRHRPERLVLAIPVAPPDTVRALREQVDELVVLAVPALFWAVGAHYEHFEQVSDDEVVAILARRRAAAEGPPPGRTPRGGPAPQRTP